MFLEYSLKTIFANIMDVLKWMYMDSLLHKLFHKISIIEDGNRFGMQKSRISSDTLLDR